MEHDETAARAHRESEADRDATGAERVEHNEAEAASDVAAERLGHDHPAAPQQVEHGFEEGFDQKRDTPEEELEPNFARGIADESRPESHHVGRFSEGIEEHPDSPENTVERRFSEGIEESPTSD
jgi:hypothetical protein